MTKFAYIFLVLDLYTNLDIDPFDRVSNMFAPFKPIG